MAEIIIPLFPLNLVVFPGERLNLHIFEPRYRQLIHECEEEGKTFVICPHHNGKNISLGTEMRLSSIEKRYKNGKLDIQTLGIKRVKIEAFYNTMMGKLYPGAEIIYLPWNEVTDPELNQKLVTLSDELYRVMGIKKASIETTGTIKTVDIAHKIGLTFEQEIEVLKISDEKDRQKYLIQHISHILPIVKEMEEMKKKVSMNGHFRSIIPPF
ncbi:MAG TPA: LON peptidase substrate-binding domain-containing protein [Saprospiraceae bacterium]|nr:LON peptidase substrate-binding domain-containing protein [Saprospiraceae bacterium]